MKCSFYIGQKVVCVDDKCVGDTRFLQDLDGLREGNLYTVRTVTPTPPQWRRSYPDLSTEIWVYLEEIHRPVRNTTYEIGFLYTRFRPATDISELEALLRTTPAKQKELA